MGPNCLRINIEGGNRKIILKIMRLVRCLFIFIKVTIETGTAVGAIGVWLKESLEDGIFMRIP